MNLICSSYGLAVNTPGVTTFVDWNVVFLSPWGTAGIVLALTVALAAMLLSVWGYRHHHRLWVRLLLMLLRLLGITALLALVLQPAVQIRNVTRVPNHVALLLDTSRSMAISETQERASRFQRARAVLEGSGDQIKKWRRHRRVDLLAFDASVRPLAGLESELEAKGPSTRIQSALSDVHRRYGGGDLAAVVIISDGIDNGHFGAGPLSRASRQFLQRLETPIHTVWIGRSDLRDLALTEVYADSFAFVHNVFRVEADLLVTGLSLKSVPITLERDGAVVAQHEVHLKEGQARYRVHFDVVPEQVGKYIYTISAPVFEGEAIKGNNRRTFLLKVIRDRIRVLQICGRPSWDERFLRQLLKRDPNVDLISFFILRTPADLALAPPSELSLIPFPTEELVEKELGSFDLVLLQNFNYKPYRIGVYLPHLRRYVEQGGGLVMIGGDQSFSSGHYYKTPIAQVLPVKLLPSTNAPSRLVSLEDFRPRLTPEGKTHPILQLGGSPRETRKMLASLPPLSGINLVAGAHPKATVLLVHPALKGTDGRLQPVLAAREVGQGRTLSLTTDSSWSWAFKALGKGGSRQAYDRFWRGAIRWLIKDPELNYLRVILEDDNIPLGSPIRAVVRLYKPDYSPARQQKVSYEIIPIGGTGVAKTVRTQKMGEVKIEYLPRKIGAHQIKVRATVGGRPTTETVLVMVDPAGKEDQEPRASAGLLQEIAKVTGGTYLERPDSLPDLSL